jgi:hypothetical protein
MSALSIRRCAPALGLAWLVAGMAAAAPAAAARHPPATPACPSVLGLHARPPVLSVDPKPGAPRVFAVQFRQDVSYVQTYASFRLAVECTLSRWVLPYLASGRPNVVVFDEDMGVMTVATGSRGAATRRLITGGIPSCRGKAFPCGFLASLKSLDAGYARSERYYRSRFRDLSPLSASFVAATDVFVRGFMQTFSDVAREHHLYVIASNTQAPFRLSRAKRDVAALKDPDLPRTSAVYVATQGRAYDQTFVWAPHDARRGGPSVLRNLVDTNVKVPLTPIETALGFVPGPDGGPAAVANLKPYGIPGTQARLGIATSLPAFQYGTAAAGHECDDVTQTYMRCLDRLGANVLIQPDANPGAWTGPDGDGVEMWQPLSWMGSAWRAVSDPSVRFAYAVNPFLTGNLADAPFDGQTAILQRGLTGRACNYVGNGQFVPGEDRPELAGDAGPKPQFLGLAPWVVPDAPRPALRAVSAQLAAFSGSPRENDYVSTAVIADLPFPADPQRSSCAGA